MILRLNYHLNYVLAGLVVTVVAVSLVFSRSNGSIDIHANNYIDNSAGTFLGTNSGTQYNSVRSGVDLVSGNTTGTFTSDIKDSASSTTTWDSLSWTSDQPYGKELPTGLAGTDLGYTNNFAMTGAYGYYRFNESSGTTTFADSSGNGFTGTCSGVCPAIATNNFLNNTLQLNNQSNQFVKLPTGVSLAQNQTKFSLSMWINPASISVFGTKRYLYEEPIGVLSPVTPRLQLSMNGGVVTLEAKNNDIAGATTVLATSTRVLSTMSTWYNIAFTVDTTISTNNVHLYISGVDQGNFSVPLNQFPNTNSGNRTAVMAYTNGSGTTANKFNGKMDEVALFRNRILTPTEAQRLYLRGGWRAYITARSCPDAPCSGIPFVGPTGLTGILNSFSENNSTVTTQPSFVLNQTIFPPRQYFQYQIQHSVYTGLDVVSGAASSIVNSLNIGYTPGTFVFNPSLSFTIRNDTDTASTNSCDLGIATNQTLASCSYRLKVSTNAVSGYNIFVQTSAGGLSDGVSQINNALAGSSGSGGSDISNTTVGTENYGVTIISGSTTSASSVLLQSAFSAGTNSVLYDYSAIPLKIIQVNGANLPTTNDLINTTLITHKLNISGDTPPGNFSQNVTYTVSPVF